MAGGRLIIPNADPVYQSPGVPAGGATLNVYGAGTTTPADIFAEEALSTPLTNPQVANQSGLFYTQSTTIWANAAAAYDIVLTTPDGTIVSYDNISLVESATSSGDYLQNPSVNLTGAPTSTTPASNDNSSKIATTAYVTAAISAIPASQTPVTTTGVFGVSGVATGTGSTTSTWACTGAVMTSSNGSTSPITVSTAVTGSVNLSTTGLNGLDSGTVASNTFYWVYLISDGTTPGFTASTSPNAPTFPTGYTYSKIAGVIKTDGSATVVPFTFFGKSGRFDYLTNPMNTIVNNAGTGGAWRSYSFSAFVPANYLARYHGTLWGGNNTQNYAAAPYNPGTPSSGSNLGAAEGYAWSLTGSNGGLTISCQQFDFPYINNNVWYNGTGSTGSLYFNGFTVNF